MPRCAPMTPRPPSAKRLFSSAYPRPSLHQSSTRSPPSTASWPAYGPGSRAGRWIDEWLADRALPNADLAAVRLELAAGRDGLSPELLRDAHFRRLIGVNEHEGVEYFSKEASNRRSRRSICTAARRRELVATAAKSGYRVDGLAAQLAPAAKMRTPAAKMPNPADKPAKRRPSLQAAAVTLEGRVVIENVTPRVDDGHFPVKRVVGDTLIVEADVFADGHDELRAVLRTCAPLAAGWHETEMEPLGNDRWRAAITLTDVGRWQYDIAGWVDPFRTWQHDLKKRVDAKQDVTVDLQIGAALIRAAAKRAGRADNIDLSERAKRLTVREALSAKVASTVDRYPDRSVESTLNSPLEVVVDPVRSRFSAWYEMFPRSASPERWRHGTFRDVIDRLPYVKRLGFDVLYLPPIHPIGRHFRKGANNATEATASDPGVPWAIGGPEGGHTAIHPEPGQPWPPSRGRGSPAGCRGWDGLPCGRLLVLRWPTARLGRRCSTPLVVGALPELAADGVDWRQVEDVKSQPFHIVQPVDDILKSAMTLGFGRRRRGNISYQPEKRARTGSTTTSCGPTRVLSTELSGWRSTVAASSRPGPLGRQPLCPFGELERRPCCALLAAASTMAAPICRSTVTS